MRSWLRMKAGVKLAIRRHWPGRCLSDDDAVSAAHESALWLRLLEKFPDLLITTGRQSLSALALF